MSGIGGSAQFGLRWQAIGLRNAGKICREISRELNVHFTTVSRWCKKYDEGELLEDQPRSGRPSVLNRVSKIVIAKSLTKKRQSTRKLSRKLTDHGHPVSHMTIQRYFVKDLGARAYRRTKIPKLTEEHVEKRLKFCRERSRWTEEDWRKVIFSDESPYELYPSGNPKNDIIWASERGDVEPIEKQKYSPKVMVWGAMTSTCLSELHVIPQKTSVNGQYYRENILKNSLLPMFDRRRTTGPISERKLPDEMSKMVFMQDGARAHTASLTLEWLDEHQVTYWGPQIWPPNSPDLNPIENLWSILEEKVKDVHCSPRNITELEQVLKQTWKQIKLETLENLIFSMPDRVRDVIKNKGHYVI